ncbi:MAG: tetratricopeptide repeat protein, partial [Candidatus Methylomirabilales bacterium]
PNSFPVRTMRSRFLFTAITLLAIIVGIAAFMTWHSLDGRRQVPVQTPPATYVGRQVCTTCHKREHDLWSGSHHDLAMQVATEETVLGDFNNATFTYHGVTSTFSKRDQKFFVRTDGPDGKLHQYDIKYTFGASPLQQYLIEFPDGRYQVLGIGWDSRPASDGGHRWFHLYPDEKITHNDILHWTGPNQNWNYMCAECHSTNLKKNYDLEHDRYETTWSEIDVSCEACHGPGPRHVEWAQAVSRGEKSQYEGQKGLVVQLKDPNKGTWDFDTETATAKRSTPLQSHIQIETCARCHSRRAVIHDDYVHGRPLMDTHRPALLTEALYHADGQILEEVYVYGSFLQSKMYHAGVTCSDCHDPHSLKVHAEGNALCAQCHLPKKFDTPLHHFHKPGSPGAQCVECHMPTKTYMVVDPRRDHSMRVPRPDLSVKLATPNACNGCHTDRGAQWAADAVAKWYGPGRSGEPHFGEALHAGRKGLPDAGNALMRLAGDGTQPNIARASALSLLRRYPSPASVRAIQRGLEDDDPLVRLSALSTLEVLEPKDRFSIAYPLLNDPIRMVRIEAASVLAPAPRTMMTREQRASLDTAITEYIESQRVNADRPGSHLNLGVLYTRSGKFDKAEAAYRTALRIDPAFVQAYINLADLYRLEGRDDQGERILREALTIAPRDADVHHALGLLLVRQQRMSEAVKVLGQSATLRPDNPHYSYVYAVALHTTGRPKDAIKVLDETHVRHPNDREVLYGLVTFNRDMGNLDAATLYAEKLIALSPQDPTARHLLNQLKQQ